MRTRKTHQTELVLQAVHALDHPTASDVLKAVNEQDPTVSRATVFRVLAEAAESGEVQRLVLAGSSDCFDITLCRHAHMVCSRCGAISDVEIADTEALEKSARGVSGGRIDACHVQFFGLCPACNKE
ncbi:MAG: transcriptional repressor [Clostridia bacterium]|nr:transcriptional repressor [Clostridia bacterium]